MRTKTMGQFRNALICSAAVLVAAPQLAMAQRSAAVRVEAQPLEQSLKAIARQTGTNILFTADTVRGIAGRRVSGQLTARAAVEQLIAGTGLEVISDGNAGLIVRRPANRPVAQTSAAEVGGEEAGDEQGRAEILVVGSVSQNADIKRTRNDVKPYVVFDRADIEKAKATDIGDFLKTRLPSNAAKRNETQNGDDVTGIGATNISRIDLRDLGASQTLILIDGRRVAGFGSSNILTQPDINAIPLSAIERIEVLPSSASGIYGGGATGGVINIILKRDFKGIEVGAQYGSDMRFDAPNKRFDFSGGMSLLGGTANVMVTGSYSESGDLKRSDRGYTQTARNLLLARDARYGASGTFTVAGNAPNFRSSTAAPLVLLDGTALNSRITRIPVGFNGDPAQVGAVLLANAGQQNTTLADDARGLRRDLMAATKTWSLSASGKASVTSAVDVFLNGQYSYNQSRTTGTGESLGSYALAVGAPNNPFRQAVSITLPLPGIDRESVFIGRTYGVVGGVIARLSPAWTASLEYNWSGSENTNATYPRILTAAGRAALNQTQRKPDGTAIFNYLIDTQTYPLNLSPYRQQSPTSVAGPYRSRTDIASLRLAGKLLALPAGDITLSSNIEHRSERILDGSSRSIGTSDALAYVFYPGIGYTIRSAYAEATIPIFSREKGFGGLGDLSLTAAARREESTLKVPNPLSADATSPSLFPTSVQHSFVDFKSTDYTVGAKWSPVKPLILRASYSTGFFPPDLFAVGNAVSVSNYSGTGITDPKRGNVLVGQDLDANGLVIVPQLKFGGNPELDAERTRSWSAGAILEFGSKHAFRFSVDFTRIKKAGEINYQQAVYFVTNEAKYPDRIQRGPLTAADAARGYTAGPILLIDQRPINVAYTLVTALDFQADYRTRLIGGDFHLYGLATRNLQFKRQALPGSPVVDYLSYFDGPLVWRGNAGFDWASGDFSLTWNTQYFDRYRISYADPSSLSLNANRVLFQASRWVPSQAYSDIGLGYKLHPSFARGGIDLSLTVQNVFNKKAPIVSVDSSGNGYSFYGDPRDRRFLVSTKARF